MTNNILLNLMDVFFFKKKDNWMLFLLWMLFYKIYCDTNSILKIMKING